MLGVGGEVMHRENSSEGGAFAFSNSADKLPETPLFRAYCLQQSEKIKLLTNAIIRDQEKLPQVNKPGDCPEVGKAT